MNELPLNRVLCGDCREVMKDFPDNSIDLVVTDPPYGLNFMGKAWDKTLPPKEAFTEIVRVLKPGAIAFINSSPRQDLFWRMLQMLDSVGLMLDVSFIDWIYKTGFPKAYDVSKGIDKKLGLKREKGEKKRDFLKYNVDITSGNSYEMAGNRIHRDEIGYETIPVSSLAKRWEGWKSLTGLKPAHEPIIFSYKPLSESTIVDNILKWGVGAINVDACRIPFQGEDPEAFANNFDDSRRTAPKFSGTYNQGKVGEYRNRQPQLFKGRFPANLLVSDKALDNGTITKSGTLEDHHVINSSRTRNIYGEYKDQPPAEHVTYGDKGGQSRYFDLDAWAKHRGFLDVPKPDNKERDFGLKGAKSIPTSKLNLSDGKNIVRLDGAIPRPRRNIHPTVKPIKLMAYLIELGCPPDGVVLDPFMGTGTTCIAAKQLVRKFIGIEINPEYYELARARVEAHPVPLSWFGVSTENKP